MVQGVIGKENLKKLIAAVEKDGSFYGPIMGSEGVSLSELDPDDEVVLDYLNFTLPPKRQFFPQNEVIYTYEGGDITDALLSGETSEGIRVIFGVRPCDVLSLLYLDKVFLDEKFIDPYYRTRRDNSIIISLACSDPLETCFCTSVGGSPVGNEGADILAFDVGDALLFEAATPKGEDFMKAHSGLFEEPEAEHTRTRDEQASSAEKKVPVMDVSDITERLQANFDSPIWDEIAGRCLSCGVCTYVCPTCHCFGLYDEAQGGEIELKGCRIRVQDGCMFPSFTLEASGHNPRTSNGERMRQRMMHKFRYTVENFGDIFCVGCGRCIGHCPVNIDIRETLAEVLK
jgi:ferredoxin